MRTLYDGEFLKLIRDRHWEYVQRQHASGAAFVIALSDAQEIILVEQFRIPLQQSVIELPAGIIADSAQTAGEAPELCALRELEEETGYRGSEAEIVCSGPVAAGMTGEMGHFVRVRKLERVSAGGGVDGENITVHLVPLAEITQWMKQKQAQGVLLDPRIYIALYFLQNS